jgi:hypothetical protein
LSTGAQPPISNYSTHRHPGITAPDISDVDAELADGYDVHAEEWKSFAMAAAAHPPWNLIVPKKLERVSGAEAPQWL